MYSKEILIGGGTGLVGKALAFYLHSKGFHVSVLTRKKSKDLPFRQYLWDPAIGEIDPSAVKDKSRVINLAGIGILDKRWSPEYKKLIIDSRVDSTRLLIDQISRTKSVQHFISASAVGYYGMDTGEALVNESTKAGTDFLAEVVTQWEDASKEIPNHCIRTLARIGVVLAEEGGALPKLCQPIRFGIGSPLGSGKQFIPWIHLMDLCAAFEFMLEKKITGPVNLVAPEAVNNHDLTKLIAKNLRRPLIMPAVPAFVLQMLLGKQESKMILGGNRVEPSVLQAHQFPFVFPDIQTCIHDLVGNS